MSDVTCRKCGEPWDSYGITYSAGDGDMTILEAEEFRRGRGCPSCELGTIYTHCRGTGKEPLDAGRPADCYDCPVCRGDGKFRPVLSEDERFHALVGMVEASDDPDSLLEDWLE